MHLPSRTSDDNDLHAESPNCLVKRMAMACPKRAFPHRLRAATLSKCVSNVLMLYIAGSQQNQSHIIPETARCLEANWNSMRNRLFAVAIRTMLLPFMLGLATNWTCAETWTATQTLHEFSLTAPAQLNRHIECLGERSGVWGSLDQGMEGWAYPFKLARPKSTLKRDVGPLESSGATEN